MWMVTLLLAVGTGFGFGAFAEPLTEKDKEYFKKYEEKKLPDIKHFAKKSVDNDQWIYVNKQGRYVLTGKTGSADFEFDGEWFDLQLEDRHDWSYKGGGWIYHIVGANGYLFFGKVKDMDLKKYSVAYVTWDGSSAKVKDLDYANRYPFSRIK